MKDILYITLNVQAAQNVSIHTKNQDIPLGTLIGQLKYYCAGIILQECMCVFFQNCKIYSYLLTLQFGGGELLICHIHNPPLHH